MRDGGVDRQLFEKAHAYRAVYALRSAYDRAPVLTVSAAIAYDERLRRVDRAGHDTAEQTSRTASARAGAS